MIEAAELVERLIMDCPGFEEKIEARFSVQGGDDFDLDEHLDLLVEHILETYERGDRNLLTKIFTTIDTMLVQGDEEVKSAVVVGLLEGIHKQCKSKSFGPDVFLSWLGSQTRTFCLDIREEHIDYDMPL